MAIYGIYIINKAGGLIYQLDHTSPRIEVEKTFSYPLDLTLKIFDEKITVAFGQRDGIKVGHSVLAINGTTAAGRQLDDGTDILELIASEEKYPLAIKFGKPKLSANEKIMLAGMFHSLYAISCQLSPVPKSSGIQLLETDSFKLHCMQILTGMKFMVVTDPRAGNQEAFLKKIHEIYGDFALKNPFYSIDMPIRCELFDSNVQQFIEQTERFGQTG